MFTKWRIEILKGYYFDEDGNLWKSPFESVSKKSIDWRMIKMQYPNRWKIGNQYYSKNKLRKHLILMEKPIEIYRAKELPF